MSYADDVMGDVRDRVGEQEEADDAARFRAALLTASELIKRPPPEYLVDGILPKGALGCVFGRPGSAKTFLVLDVALRVAGGLPWGVREVRGGPVLYIAAEGSAGLGTRIRAWLDHANLADIDNIQFLPLAVNLLDVHQRAALLVVTAEINPVLIVVDTMARSMVGGDENSARDVGLVIDAADKLRLQTSAAVVLVHHTGKDGQTYRGSSALEGACDTMVEVLLDGDVVTVRCEKQKDAEPFEPIRMRLVTVNLGDASSCVLEASHGGLSESQERLLMVFVKHFGSTGATKLELRTMATGAPTSIPIRSFYRALNQLVADGVLVNTGTDKQPFYKLATTESGQTEAD